MTLVTLRRYGYTAAGVTALLLLPLLTDRWPSVQFTINLAGAYALVAIGLNLLLGYAGQISIGHAAFFGIGAYASALLTLKAHLPFWAALPLAGVVTALCSPLLGIPALRLSGHYLAIATLGFGAVVPQILIKWDRLTGGFGGLSPEKPTLFGIALDTDIRYYYLVLAVLLICWWSAANLLKTSVGRAWMALRDSETAAAASGIQVAQAKVLVFTVSAFYTGLAGSLYAHAMGFINPYDFTLQMSLEFLTMIVVGGLSSLGGSVLGAVFVTALPQLLSRMQDLPHILFGVILIAVVMFLPGGLVQLATRLLRPASAHGAELPAVAVKKSAEGG